MAKIPRSKVYPQPPDIPTGGGLGHKFAETLARGITRVRDLFTEWLEDRLINFGVDILERIEGDLAPLIEPMVTKLYNSPSCPPEIKPLLEQLRHPTQQGIGAVLGGLGASVATQGLGAIINAPLAGVGYAANRTFLPTRLDPGAALLLKWRGDPAAAQATGDLLDQGWSVERQEALLRLVRQLPTGGDLLEMVNRGYVSEADALTYLQWSGFTASDANGVLSLRFKFADINTVAQLYIRKEISETEHDARLLRAGIPAQDVALLKRLYFPVPGPQDLITMAVKEAFSEEQAAILGLDAEFPTDFAYWGERSGLSEYWAKKYWRAHWQLPSPQMGYEMLHRGVINDTELDALIKALDYTPYWRGKLKAISYNTYTRVDTRRMYQLGILTAEGVLQSYKDQGYDDEHATNLALFTVLGASEKEKDLTKADVIGGYKDGLLSRADASQFVVGMGYDSAEADFYLTRADLDLVTDRVKQEVETVHSKYLLNIILEGPARNEMAALGLAGVEIERKLQAWKREREAKVQTLTKSDIEQMYDLGMLTHDTASLALQGIGFLEPTARQLLAVWDAETAKAQQEKLERGVRVASNSEVAKLIAQGLITERRARELLEAKGYAEESVTLYLASWRQTREQQAAEEAAATEKRALAAIRKPSASEVRQLWDQGIIAEATARSLLADLNYTAEALEWTMALWSQLKIEAERKEAESKRRAEEVRPKLLSTAQLHEMFLSDIIAEEATRTGLKALQYTDDDIARFLTLWQQDKAEAQAREELEALKEEERRQRLLSRSQVGELYLAKITSRERTLALLIGLRYSEADIRDTLTLWDMRLAEMAAAEAAGQPAAAERKVKTLSRADLANLYKSFIISETEARAALDNLAYLPSDIDRTVSLWDSDIASTMTRDEEKQKREQLAARRLLTKAQLEQMFSFKIIVMSELVAGYRQLKYSEEDIARLLEVLRQKTQGATP